MRKMVGVDALKLAADKHLARAHGYKLAGDGGKAHEHTMVAYHLNAARRFMEACAASSHMAQ